MAEQSLKDFFVKGVIWSSVERFSVQGVQFLVMLVIARILDPKDFGLLELGDKGYIGRDLLKIRMFCYA